MTPRFLFHLLLPVFYFLPSAFWASSVPAIIDTARSPHAVLRPLPYDAVQWTTGFWADRFHQLAETTLDESWRLLADPEKGHVLDNFRAAATGQGAYAGTQWQDEWLYKWLEAATCAWRTTRNPALAQRINEAIALIAAAQQSDGYISTNIIARKLPRFTEPRNHEIYNMGHLITAGVIHGRLTGETALFDIARKAADFLCATIGVTIDPAYAHNPSAIMGLVELYRETDDKKYLDCAARIVDGRGANPKKQTLFTMTPGIAGTDVIQDRVPVRQSSEIVGHNVFFTYLYTGASDVYSETGDTALRAALDRLWEDLTQRKMYIHGGVSARHMGVSNFAPVIEAAGAPYELPNAHCYNETCGQIGCLMWGYRMLLATPDSRYADIMEREMYNGFLPAQSLDGKHWFYRNIIRRYDKNYQPTGGNDMTIRGQPGRREICCPSNLMRTLAQLSSYFYSTDNTGALWIHHYGGSRATAGVLAIEQMTDYPWSGDIRLTVNHAPANPVTLHLRIPGWAAQSQITLDGRPLDPVQIVHGYITLTRTWKPGDTLTLSLPMTPQLIAAHPRIEETRNQVAVMRGPVLYCVESPDLPDDINVSQIYLLRRSDFAPEPGIANSAEPLAKSAYSLKTTALCLEEPRAWNTLYRPFDAEKFRPITLRLIPYYAWSNRGKSAMSVWMPLAWQNGPPISLHAPPPPPTPLSAQSHQSMEHAAPIPEI